MRIIMGQDQNRRGTFRRYADRRTTALLELHEVLFYEDCGPDRDHRLFSTLAADYEVDRVGLVSLTEGGILLRYTTGYWGERETCLCLEAPSIQRIVAAHAEFDGALTLSKFRRSSLFSQQEWDNLWSQDLIEPATALLSVAVTPRTQSAAFLWFVLDASSREWSSHDRDLAEEEAHLVSILIDRKKFFFQQKE